MAGKNYHLILQREFHLVGFSCQANQLDSGADFVGCPLVELVVHIVANGEKFFNAVDQCANDHGLFWNFEDEGDVVLHGSNLLQDDSKCKDYFDFF